SGSLSSQIKHSPGNPGRFRVAPEYQHQCQTDPSESDNSPVWRRNQEHIGNVPLMVILEQKHAHAYQKSFSLTHLCLTDHT
ncbi:hypothetical protein, partial [Escherichia coli]|uniref:hypothetical protein n=1 Tax=Escherichia coli TaxID=562 RepID=UPI00235FC1F2